MAVREKYITVPSFLIRVLTIFGLWIFETGSLYIGVTISNEYENLKQTVSFNFNGVDFRDAMDSLADIGGINIIVGEEVSGTVTAKLQDVGWDVAFRTLLDMKTLGADIDVARGIIRVHTPEKLTAQETLKSARAEV